MSLLLALSLSLPAAAEGTAGPADAGNAAVHPAVHPAHGTWALSSSKDQVDAQLDAAADRVLEEFPAIFRGIARSKLEHAMTVCDRYHFVVQDDAFALKCDEQATYTRPIAGVHQTTGKDGQPLKSSLALRDDGFELKWMGENGDRTNTIRVQGDTLVLQVAVTSDKLPKPLTWELRYGRR